MGEGDYLLLNTDWVKLFGNQYFIAKNGCHLQEWLAIYEAALEYYTGSKWTLKYKKYHSHQWTWYATPFYPTQVCNINKCSMTFSLFRWIQIQAPIHTKVFCIAGSLQIPFNPHIRTRTTSRLEQASKLSEMRSFNTKWWMMIHF